ncbi:MAG: hypothetical protein ACQETH_08685 [Candidatus Rifleibacteriota bacterium]
MHNLHISRRKVALSAVFLILALISTAQASVTELDAIGKIESIYRDRVTMRIIKILGTDTAELPVQKGSWISFDLPSLNGKNRNRRNNVSYGSVVEASLIGNVTTEYEKDLDKSEDSAKQAPVLLWTAQSVKKVKRPNEYLSKKDKEKGRKGNKQEREEEETKVWTQEETVRGKINFREKDKKLYIKEERMGRRDKGLDVVDDLWYKKLKDFHGQKVVVHGTTNRSSISSGTIEIENLLKIYSK